MGIILVLGILAIVGIVVPMGKDNPNRVPML